MDNAIKRKAETKLRLGVDPLKVHEWIMQQGCKVEEADKITGCRTFPSAEKMRETCAPQDNATKGD